MAVETENFKGKHWNLKVSSESYLWKLSKITDNNPAKRYLFPFFFFHGSKNNHEQNVKKDKSERNAWVRHISDSAYRLEDDFHQEMVFLRASNDCQTVQNTHWVTIVWWKEAGQWWGWKEAIESVSVIDGLITSRIVYENNTVND